MEPTLSRDAYVDDDWFGRERDRIFFNQKFCVGRLEEIPQPGLHTDPGTGVDRVHSMIW